jgi:hypothetical protein
MTNKLDILGQDELRCLWYMELHYGSSFKDRDVNSFPCPKCKGYDFKCSLYQPNQHGYTFKAIEEGLHKRLQSKKVGLENEVHRHD